MIFEIFVVDEIIKVLKYWKSHEQEQKYINLSI